MDNIIVGVIMVGMAVAFVTGAVIAHKKGNAGFAAAVKYDERLAEKNRQKKEDKE